MAGKRNELSPLAKRLIKEQRGASRKKVADEVTKLAKRMKRGKRTLNQIEELLSPWMDDWRQIPEKLEVSAHYYSQVRKGSKNVSKAMCDRLVTMAAMFEVGDWLPDKVEDKPLREVITDVREFPEDSIGESVSDEAVQTLRGEDVPGDYDDVFQPGTKVDPVTRNQKASIKVVFPAGTTIDGSPVAVAEFVGELRKIDKSQSAAEQLHRVAWFEEQSNLPRVPTTDQVQ